MILSPICQFGLVRAQAFHLARNDEIFILAEHNAAFSGELLRALSDEVDMRAFAQDLARSAQRAAQVPVASHTTGAKRGKIHNQRIELHAPIPLERAATPGTERLDVFQDY